MYSKKITICLLIQFYLFLPTYASIQSYITTSDKRKLFTVLTRSFINEPNDFTTPYYGAKAFKILAEPIAKVLINDNCAHIKKFYKVECTPEENFQALNAWQLLACPGKLHTDKTIKDLQSILEIAKSTIDIHYALETLKLLEAKITNGPKIAQNIQNRLKEDDSLLSLGHALHSAALLGNDGSFIKDRIEEVVVQADEVDGKLLQWEGGLTTTSLLLTGLLRISGVKPLTNKQAEKFGAYLLTRKTVQTPRGALALIEAVNALANSDVSPISIVIPIAQVTIDKPELTVHISDILGRPVKNFQSPVVAQTATRIVDDVVVLSKQSLTPSNSIEFVLVLKLEPGQYRIVLSAGAESITATVRVLGPITVEWLQVGLSDADGSSAPRLQKLSPPSKLPQPLRADSSQHLLLKFSISRVAHQAFLRLFSGKTEITFVAEVDSSKTYKVDVNLASELSHSGNFDMELIVGDSVMSNSLRWNLGTVELSLAVAEPEKKTLRGLKPEIKHLFRPAEKRPSETVSMLFTGLTLAPLGLLLILWLKIGINFENFTVLSIPFYIGFGSILYLFTLFWWKLDMFTTCAWLIPIGFFTFLAGQKLLSHIAKEKKG